MGNDNHPSYFCSYWLRALSMNCHAGSVALALSYVLLHRLVGLGPPDSCPLLRHLWTADPWYPSIFTHSDSDPVTAFVRATALISDRGPTNFEGVAAKLPELHAAWWRQLRASPSTRLRSCFSSFSPCSSAAGALTDVCGRVLWPPAHGSFFGVVFKSKHRCLSCFLSAAGALCLVCSLGFSSLQMIHRQIASRICGPCTRA